MIQIYCMVVNPDGNKLLSGDKDGLIFVWDIKTFKNINFKGK